MDPVNLFGLAGIVAIISAAAGYNDGNRLLLVYVPVGVLVLAALASIATRGRRPARK